MTRQRFLSTTGAAFLGMSGLFAAESAPLAKKDLKAAIQNAKTPEDHQRIAAYYQKEADRMLAEAKEHEELAAVYAKSPSHAAKHPMSGPTEEHCKFFADAARKAAQASKELAKAHEEMARAAR